MARWQTVAVVVVVNITIITMWEMYGIDNETSSPPTTTTNDHDQVVGPTAASVGSYVDTVGAFSSRFSSFTCVDAGADTFAGDKGSYGFPIVNRSCVYHNIVFDPVQRQFVFHAASADITDRTLPPVSLASRPYDLPIRHYKRVILKRKVSRAFDWRPMVVHSPIPSTLPRKDRTLLYYAPIVAPWNYAHTLLCDLFALFWAMRELGIFGVLDGQVVAFSAHHGGDFPLPNKNVAFKVFSTRPPMYDADVPAGVYSRLVVGSGTKSWSWLTPEYRASGSPDLWWTFREHIKNVTGAVEPNSSPPRDAGDDDGNDRPLHVSICHKKDKRGIYNYDEALGYLRKAFPETQATFALETAVGLSPREQVELMLRADVYMCNEGTLASSLFLLRPGSVFLSLPLVYHTPHLHQRRMPPESTWWAIPDPLRPDPRLNTGGNIDFFPPAIPWVTALWYDAIPLNETRIQLPLRNLRNYMPDYNIILSQRRIVPLMAQAIRAVGQRSSSWAQQSSPTTTANYGVNADLCRRILQRAPELVRSFNSARCFFGMSWLCEFWTNTNFKWRMLHEKWSLSRGNCGDRRSSPSTLGLEDPRRVRNIHEFLFYSRSALEKAYRTTDLGNLSATDEELDAVFNFT